MKEALIYGVIALSSLVTFAYTVHMFIGGLVNAQTERLIMAAATLVWALVIGLLARDVVKRRRNARYETTRTPDDQ